MHFAPCPAKLNLFLSVGPTDAKGWHPLRTVFQTVSLCDMMTAELSDADSFASDSSSLPADNSVTRAIRLYRELTSLPPLSVALTKLIPTESGLGGGSSDAAGLLRIAQKLSPSPLPQKELFDLALRIGADVPFFLVGGRAKGEGYGERLTALPDPGRQFFVIARPEIGCSTPEMYRRLDEVEREWREFPSDDQYFNDFFSVAPPECVVLVRALREQGAGDACLTGSGSAVFGRFGSEEAGRRAMDAIERTYGCSAWSAESFTRHQSQFVGRFGSEA